MRDLDDTPSLAEVKGTVASLKNNKAPGSDTLPAKIIKQGGEAVEKKCSTHLLRKPGSPALSHSNGKTAT